MKIISSAEVVEYKHCSCDVYRISCGIRTYTPSTTWCQYCFVHTSSTTFKPHVTLQHYIEQHMCNCTRNYQFLSVPSSAFTYIHPLIATTLPVCKHDVTVHIILSLYKHPTIYLHHTQYILSAWYILSGTYKKSDTRYDLNTSRLRDDATPTELSCLLAVLDM